MPRKLSLLLAGLSVFSLGHAQPVSFKRLPAPTNEVVDIVQDHQGFLWMGGYGLHKYDGYGFTSYFHESEDSTSLSNNNVSSLLVDTEGSLWVGTDEGLHRFNPLTESFTRYSVDPDEPASIHGQPINYLYEDLDGILWIGIQGRLVRIDQERDTYTNFDLPGDSTVLRVLLQDRSGSFWVGLNSLGQSSEGGGLYEFNTSMGTFSRLDVGSDVSGVPIQAVNSMYEDKEGIFWIGAWPHGLIRYDPTASTSRIVSNPYVEAEAPRVPGIEDILEDRRGNIWLAYGGIGVHRFDRDTETFTRYANGAGHEREYGFDNINSIKLFEDRQGTLWASYIGDYVQAAGAIYKVVQEPGIFTHYAHDPDNPESMSEHRHVYAFHEDHEGKIWVATFHGGLNIFDPVAERFTRPENNPAVPKGLMTQGLNAIIEDRDGKVWVGGFGPPLQHYDPVSNRFTHSEHFLEKVNGLIPTGAVDLDQDRYGVLWIGTFWHGVIQFNLRSGAIKRYKHIPGDSTSLVGDVAYEIKEDRKGNLWIGAFGQQEDFRKGALHRFNREKGTFERYERFGASTVYEDRAGNLWLLSATRGLFQWDPENDVSKHYSIEEGLPNNTLMCMLEDGTGKLWFSSRAGLSRLDPVTETIYHFNSIGGTEKVGFSEGSNACFKAKDGTFYFGRFPGMTLFHPDQFVFNTLPPDVAITNFSIMGDSLSESEGKSLYDAIETTGQIVLNHSQNNLSITYLGLHYEDPERNTYQYILEGFSQGWIDAGRERQARFLHVPPGDYVFRVKAASPNGIWSENEAVLAFKVLPPWWRTWWAYVFYGALLVGCAITANLIQRHRQLRREREQARIREAQFEADAAAERARLAEHLEEAKSRFFINISHEFRTPLTLVLGPLRDLLEGAYGTVDGRIKQLLGVMQQNGQRLLDLINQVLDLEKLEAGGLGLRAREDDLVAFVSALTLSFTSLAEREKKTLRYESSSTSLAVYFDQSKLEKVVYNLLSNAFKFTESGATIQVRVDRQADVARIIVQDTGRGIPEPDLLHIFDRFYQVEDSSTRQYEGSGIGLSIAREFVHLHEGTLDVESTELVGSTFTIRLPLGRSHLRDEDLIEVEFPERPEIIIRSETQRESVTDTSFLNSVSDVPSDEAATILIVEDNDALRAYLKLHLHGYNVIEAENGEQGLEKTLNVLPDLVISDVMMPRMDGIALCVALRRDQRTQDIPVVMLTAKAAEDDKIEGLRAGADDYLHKPFSARELLARIENLVDQRRQLRMKYRSELVLKPNDVVISSVDAVFLEKVHSIVEAHIDDSWFGVEQLAEEVGMSRRQLHRRMNDIVNITAAAFIREMRLERAAQMLEKNAGNVSDVAYAVGYNDPRHFSKLFKKKYGHTPSEHGKQ